jgi:hypothetical protein
MGVGLDPELASGRPTEPLRGRVEQLSRSLLVGYQGDAGDDDERGARAS